MASERPPLSSVEAVRDELRRLGYLDSGLDRFVLAGAGAASPLRASMAAALRVGVVGGFLGGAALTLAAASLDRRLLDAPRDLAVLAAYLVLAVGCVTALVALLGGLVAGWTARRLQRRPGPTLARNVGLAVALGGLAYLALWWRSHSPGAPLAAQATTLLLGLGLCLLLARFGTLSAVAVLSAGGAFDRLPQASLSRQHMFRLLAAAALLLAGGVAAASYLTKRGPSAAPAFAVVPTGLRVTVLGIDGLERRMAEQMVARGEMPHLAALLARGAHARLSAEPEHVPAIVWTTIATGRGPEAHGIRSIGSRRLAGMTTPVSVADEGSFVRALGAATDLLRLTRAEAPTSVLRGVKAFWNVASEKGLRVGVVNWWATWPADAVNGYVVTDRAFFKLEKGGAPEREVHPPEAFDRLRILMADADADRARRLDRFHLRAAQLLDGELPPDLAVLYLPGLDITTMQQLGDAAAADVATLDTRLAAVREHHRFVDGLLGEVVGRLRAEDVLVLVADPGRLPRRAGAADGIAILAGAAIDAGELGVVSERDLAPTILHLAGLPTSRELDGQVLEAALTPEFRRAHAVRAVASYGERVVPRAAESTFDRAMLEELRSLGYIQ